MKNIRLNKKGFTLIELLAVIIILGILLLIAVPAVSKYIENSRKNTYINSIKSLVSAVSTSVNNLEYPLPGTGEGVIIPFEKVELEKGNINIKSPYAPYVEGKSYVLVTYIDNSYHYYVATLDEAGYAIPLIDVNKLSTTSITADTNVISGNVYSYNDIISNESKTFDTDIFSFKYKSKTNTAIKVHIGERTYKKGEVVVLKDGSKWTVLPSKDEEGKLIDDDIDKTTINVFSYYNMYTIEEEYGNQGNDKQGNAIIYSYTTTSTIIESVVRNARLKLNQKGINLTGATVDMISVYDFCGEDYNFSNCRNSLKYLNTNDNFWTKDNSSDDAMIVIINGALGTASPTLGNNLYDPSLGLRVVIRNLPKSNIDKAKTRELNK